MRVILASLVLAALAACGSSVSPADPDAASNLPDGAPDGMLANVSCTGSIDAGMASGSLSISGTIDDASGSGVSGVTVGLYMADETTLYAGSPVSTDGSGNYTVSVASAGQPITVVGKFSKNNFTSEWVYAGEPISHSYTAIDGVMLSANDLAGFGILYFSNTAYDSNASLVAIEVVDCNGAPVEGATITLSPAPQLLRYADNSGKPSKSQTATGKGGLVFGWNEPVSSGSVQTVTVGGTYHGVPLASHTFKAHKGDIVLTLIHP